MKIYAVGIGSPEMLKAYAVAAGLSGLDFSQLDGAAITPPALMSIARAARLLAPAGSQR